MEELVIRAPEERSGDSGQLPERSTVASGMPYVSIGARHKKTSFDLILIAVSCSRRR